MQPGDNTLKELKAKLKNCGAAVIWLGDRLLQIVYHGNIVAEAGIVFRGIYKLNVTTFEPPRPYTDYYYESIDPADAKIREVIEIFKNK